VTRDTPKPRSAEYRALRERLGRLFDPVSLRVVALGALDRPAAQALLARLTGTREGTFADLPREELIARLVAGFVSRPEVAYALIRELDRATRAERSLVASMPTDQVEPDIGSLNVLRFKRQGAKLVWALARDERPEVQALATKVMREYVEQFERLQRARDQVRQKGAAVELEEFEKVYREAAERVLKLEEEYSAVEKERARLIAEVGRRELELRTEGARRAKLAAELSSLKRSPPPVVTPPKLESGSKEQWEQRLHKLNKTLAAVEHERDELKAIVVRAPELEDENARLRETIDSLRDLRARERSVPVATSAPAPRREVTGASPLVAPPPRRGARQGNQARVGVYLDVANLAGTARRLYDRGIDYARLLRLVTDGRRLTEARAYAIDKGKDGFDSFAAALRHSGYKVLSKRPKTFEDGTMKADWDVGLVVDVLLGRDELDVVVLGSGDGDFLPLVSALKQQGTRVEVAVFGDRAASELLRLADRVFLLDETVLTA
jgi:uncharacterized LabA/DUF88 family protein